MVYGNGRLARRRGAMPPSVLRLLQDKGSVQQLDGPDYRHRKAMFVDLHMTDAAEDPDRHRAPRWQRLNRAPHTLPDGRETLP